jgi:CRP-like cAMP-binding protein
MNPSTILKTLQESSFTRGLAPEYLEKLAGIAFEVKFSRDEAIYREGDLGDVIYIIVSGQISVEKYQPGKGRIPILTVGPGQVLGWSAFFPEKRKTASARATAATHAVAISAPQLRELCHKDCHLGYQVLYQLANLIADRLKATRLQLIDIYSPTNLH